VPTGWSLDTVGEPTLWDVWRLYRDWRAHPPVHELAAAFLGVKAQADPPLLATAAGSATDDPSGIGAMILRSPDGQVKAHQGRRSISSVIAGPASDPLRKLGTSAYGAIGEPETMTGTGGCATVRFWTEKHRSGRRCRARFRRRAGSQGT
jgi:hypothetical protein